MLSILGVTFIFLSYIAGIYSFSYLWIFLIGLIWYFDSIWLSNQNKLKLSSTYKDLNSSLFNAKYSKSFDLNYKYLMKVINDLPTWSKKPTSEMCAWLNEILISLWPYLSNAISINIKDTINDTLEIYENNLINHIKVDVLNLGTLSPLINGIEFQNTRNEQVLLDLDVRIATTNEKIIICIQILWFKFYITLKDICFNGILRINLYPLISEFPCFENLSISFVKSPFLDFNLDLFGINITNIPFLSDYLRKKIIDILNEMLLYPTELVIPMLIEDDVQPLSLQQDDLKKKYIPLGILQVHILQIRQFDYNQHNVLSTYTGFSKISSTTGQSKTFITMNVYNDQYHAIHQNINKKTNKNNHYQIQKVKTKSLKSCKNLLFNEVYEFFIYDMKNDYIKIDVYNEELRTGSKLRGTCTIKLNGIIPEEYIKLLIPLNNTNSGHILLNILWKPFLAESQRNILSERVYNKKHIKQHRLTLGPKINQQELIKAKSLKKMNQNNKNNKKIH